jgi:PAS domain S-box-containing protein
MSAWFGQHFDYVYFVYGAAFAALALFAGLPTSKKGDPAPRVPWFWLALFGSVHGAYEWVMMVAMSFAPRGVETILLILMTISYLPLYEFGRRALRLPARDNLWMLFLPVALIAPGALLITRGAHPEAEAALRLLLAAPAAGLGAAALWRAARAPDEVAPRTLRAAAFSLAVYAVAAGLISRPAEWGLARIWNTETWLAQTGFPVHLLRAACAVALSICVWRHAHAHAPEFIRVATNQPLLRFRATLVGSALVVVATGLGAGYLGREASRSIRASLIERASAIANLLNTDLLAALYASPHDEHHPVVRAVEDQLTRAKRAFPDIQQIYLYTLRGRDFVFYACSEATIPAARIRPGEVFEGELFPEDYTFFQTSEPYTIGPPKDRWGLWVSAVVPALVGYEDHARVRLALGIDISAESYAQSVLRRRLGALVAGAIVYLLILDFFSRHYRLWIAAMLLAAAERRQRELSETLEQRVNQRTRELEETNAALRREMTGHREAEAKYRAIAERLPAIAYRVDLHPTPRTTFISPRLRDVLGYEPEAWMADPDMWKRALHPADRARVLAEVAAADREGRPLNSDFRLIANNGEAHWIRHGSVYEFDAQGRPAVIHGVMLDITEQVETDARLKESGERYRLLFQHSPAGLVHYDRALRITDVNDRFARLLGRQAADLLNANLAAIASPQLLVALKSPLLGGEGYHEGPGAFTLMPPDAWVGVRTTALRGPDKNVIGGIAIIEDLSERRRLEEDRLRVQKLESLGLLAGGLAHDFNNILTAVLGNISIVRSALPTGSDLHETLQDAERAALRARDLTQQLLTFAKGGAPVKKLHDIVALVREAAGFTVRGSMSRCVYEFDPNTWGAEVDGGQITQVVQNLVINADQAMPDGGVITLRTANRIIVDGEFPDLPPGRYVEIQVSDTGIGIPQHIRNRIFDPYFTTKKKGSGLGLTMCASIVRKHGGYIGVESTPGRGSVFTVLLPASDISSRILADASAGKPADLSGTERILVMDDEPAILELARRILTRHGYTALLAEHGEKAVQLFDSERAAGRRIDLAILDITVPGGMGGRETLRHLRERDPALPALVSSGYAQDQVLAQFKDAGFSGIVPKPYRAEELLRAIRHALPKGALLNGS